MSTHWKTKYSQNVHITPNYLHIQCNHYHNNNNIFFTESEKTILKKNNSYGTKKNLKYPKQFWDEKKAVSVSKCMNPDFKCITKLQDKIVLYCHKNELVDQWYRIVSTEINSCMYEVNGSLKIVPKIYITKKMVSSINSGKIGLPIYKRIKLYNYQNHLKIK